MRSWKAGDASAVRVDQKPQPQFGRGDLIEVEGETKAEVHSPLIHGKKFRKLGSGPVRPRRVSVEEALSPALEAPPVAHSGRRGIGASGTPSKWSTCLDGGAALRADYRSSAGTGIPDAGSGLARPPDDPFARPVRNIGDLVRYEPDGGPWQRKVRILGQVTPVEGPKIVVREGHRAVSLTGSCEGARPGSSLEAVGFVQAGDLAPVLTGALCRPAPVHIPVAATQVPDVASTPDWLHDSLVSVAAMLVFKDATPEWRILGLQPVKHRFRAVLPRDHDAAPNIGKRAVNCV